MFDLFGGCYNMCIYICTFYVIYWMTYGMAYGIPDFLMPFWGFTILLGSCDNGIHLSAPPWPCHLHHRRCRSGPGTLGNQWMSTINVGLTINSGKTWNYDNKMRCRWSDLRPFPADVPFNQFWMKSEAQWEKIVLSSLPFSDI